MRRRVKELVGLCARAYIVIRKLWYYVCKWEKCRICQRNHANRRYCNGGSLSDDDFCELISRSVTSAEQSPSRHVAQRNSPVAMIVDSMPWNGCSSALWWPGIYQRWSLLSSSIRRASSWQVQKWKWQRRGESLLWSSASCFTTNSINKKSALNCPEASEEKSYETW